jgi:purine-binding chemotaxis protein CheW
MSLATAPSRGPESAKTHQYCTFWAGGLYFGIDVRSVQEVLRYQLMSSVPQAPKAVSGLINLRGQIVTAIDLRHRLDLVVAEPDGQLLNVIVSSRNEVVSLLVDDIGDVIDTGDATIEPTPATLPAHIRDVVEGVLALPNEILLVLGADLAADVTPPNRTTGGRP